MDNNSLKEIIQAIPEFQLELKLTCYSNEAFSTLLSEKINHLINSNFSQLVTILYRLDISEHKLKELLALSSDIPAGNVIAAMIIERQLQKIESRKQFQPDTDIDGEERW